MKQEMIKNLIELYQEYLDNTVKERTLEMNNLENGSANYGKKEKVLLKGYLDGFINYLINK